MCSWLGKILDKFCSHRLPLQSVFTLFWVVGFGEQLCISTRKDTGFHFRSKSLVPHWHFGVSGLVVFCQDQAAIQHFRLSTRVPILVFYFNVPPSTSLDLLNYSAKLSTMLETQILSCNIAVTV